MSLLPRVLLGLVLWAMAAASLAQGAPLTDIDQSIRQADSLQDQGRNADARKIYESLLRSLRERPPSRQLGYVLNAMSQVEAADGNYEASAASAQESADVYHGLGDARGEAHAYNNRGIAEIESGDYGGAQLHLELALELARSAGDSENEVQIFNNLGSSFFFQGKYQEAQRGYEDAVQTMHRAQGAKWVAYWRQITNFNQATLYQRLGRYEKALQVYREVQASSKALTTGDRAHVLANLGTLYRRLGDPWKALESYRQAQKLYSTAHDADGEISVLKNIGIVYALDQNDFSKAERIFRSVQSLAERSHNRREEMQSHLYLGETLLRARAPTSANEQFQAALSLTQELGTTEEQWKALYGLGRIAESSGDRDTAEADYRKAVGIIEQSRAQLQLSSLRTEFLADKRDVYDSLISILLNKGDIPTTFSFLERSRSRIFQDRVADLHRAKHDSGNYLSLSEVRSRLDPATVLLEYWTAGDRMVVIWCRRDAYGASIRKLTPEERNRLTALLQTIPNGSSGDWRQRLSDMSMLLPSDPAWLRNDTAHVVVIPDGWLSLVPFDLLPVSKNRQELLIERHDVFYMPSAVLLRRRVTKAAKARFPWTRELVAFGSPVIRGDFASGSTTSAGRNASGKLPGAEREARDIAEITPGKSELFLGNQDLKRVFLARANSGLLLHVSTHAFADDSNPEDSRLLFTPEDRDAVSDFVYLRELYALDLQQVRLATISACDTERGRIIRGEGVQAFSRALLSAGARASLTTLWRVDDAATAEFMKQFYYFALEERLPPAEALRKAKLKFLNSNTALQQPRYWAAFVLNGDGLARLPAVLPWKHLIAIVLVGLALVLFAVMWVVLWHRRRIHGKHNARSVVAS